MNGPSPLDQLAESYVDLRWHLDPVEGSQAGVSAYDGRLGSFTDDRVREFLVALRSLMGAAEELSVESLDDEIDRTALLDDMRVADHRFRSERPHVRDPNLWVGQALEGLYQLLLFRDRDGAARRRAARARLDAVPGLLEEARATLADCPAVLVEPALDAARGGVDLVGEVEREFGRGDPTEAGGFSVPAAAARDALRLFEAHLDDLLRRGPPDTAGIGAAALQFRLRHQHSLSDTPETLLRYAAGLIEETEQALATVARALGSSHWADALDRLRADGPPEVSLVAAYRDVVARARAHVEQEALVTVPEAPLEVRETPSYARPWIPLAAYLPPGPMSGDRRGYLFVTAADTGAVAGAHCRHALPATAVHESFPGHHLHLLTAEAQPRSVRRLLHSPVSVEGWALYAEGLMEEVGFFVTPGERLFQLVALLWRALRVPLDVGLHTGSLDRQTAVRQLTNRLHLTHAQAEAEVRRVFASPGYQLAYAVGRREVLRMRETYRALAGADYTHRTFHDAVLRFGALPASLARWGLGLDG